jgi:uncharacterized glyoxalase superfamily protein PhnB
MPNDSDSFEARELAASLTVRELDRSVAWYRDVLGFAVDRVHEREGKKIAASLRAGAARILLAQDDGAKGLDRAKGEGFSLQFTTEQDIDTIAARVAAHGTAFATPPTDMPWGPRVFRVRDPDGFLLVVTSGGPPRT